MTFDDRSKRIGDDFWGKGVQLGVRLRSRQATAFLGENPIRVGELGIQFMKGMQDNGVLACAKHFPGHGDTDEDSHKSLPIINHTKERLDTCCSECYKCVDTF